MMRILTPIFPADVKPVRDGWYLVNPRGFIDWRMMWFSEQGWSYSDRSLSMQAAHSDVNGWRGLAFDPDAAEPCVAHSKWAIIAPAPGVFVPGGECC